MTHNTLKLDVILLDNSISGDKLNITIIRASPETPALSSRPKRESSLADIKSSFDLIKATDILSVIIYCYDQVMTCFQKTY